MTDSTQVAKKSKLQTEAQKKVQPSIKQPKPSEMDVKRLNDSASMLLRQLPDHAGQLVETLAKQYSMPIWQYVTGILLAVHLEGRLSEFRLDPAWKDGLKTKELKCQYKPCSKMFKPRHIGQPYCTNECGTKATGPKEIQDVTNITNIPTPVMPKSADASTVAGWDSSNPSMEAA